MAARIIAWGFGLVLTALYASVVVAAIGNFLLLPDMAGTMGLGISGTGWFWLVFGIAMPVLVFVVSLLFGRRRSAAPRLLALAAGLGVVAVVQLEVAILVPQQILFA